MGHQLERRGLSMVVCSRQILVLFSWWKLMSSPETYYLAYPSNRKTDIAILYLTDIFGNALVNNRLYVVPTPSMYMSFANWLEVGGNRLADSLARAGYFVAMPDLFRFDPVPLNAMGERPSGFNMTAWTLRHPQAEVETIITSAIGVLKSHFKSQRIGAAVRNIRVLVSSYSNLIMWLGILLRREICSSFLEWNKRSGRWVYRSSIRNPAFWMECCIGAYQYCLWKSWYLESTSQPFEYWKHLHTRQ